MDSWEKHGSSATTAKGQVNIDNIHWQKQQSRKQGIDMKPSNNMENPKERLDKNKKV